jgi:hypothetical protein
MEAHIVTLICDYHWSYGKKLMYRYEISWVAHYAIDMVSNLYDEYGIELCISYSLILMVDVMLVGWLVHGIEWGQVRK